MRRPRPTTPVNVLTFHNNNRRLGLNSQETTFTPANVNPTTFGKVGFLPTDGQVYAQPLFVSNVTVNGTIHNVVYVVTQHDRVYAFDADTGAKLWKTSALLPGEARQIQIADWSTRRRYYRHSDHRPAGRGPGLIYLVTSSKDGNKAWHQRLHALDLVTGAECLGGPVEFTGKYPGQARAARMEM